MVASSLITVASIPIYSVLFHRLSTVGLAMASDLGIVADTLALALLLHRRQLVRVNELNWAEIGKAVIMSLVAGWLSYQVARLLLVNNSRVADLKALGLNFCHLGGAPWRRVCGSRDHLCRGDLRRRKPTAYPRVAERQAEELGRGMEP